MEQKILGNAINRILETPTTMPMISPNRNRHIIEAIVDRKQILYYQKKIREQKETTVAKTIKDASNIWTKQLYKKMEKYNLNSDTTLVMTKTKLQKKH